jgi:pimeloyl-ACP methyl ester carboxylesterase
MRWLLPCLLTCSCGFLREATVPMPAIVYPAKVEPADGLVVLLPGYGDGPERFDQQGFVAAIQQADPRLEVIAADAHYGYYRERSVVERLHTDLLAPRIERYERVWFVGISMGGLGSAIYAMERPGEIDGMILLAPYMGPSELIGEIDAAGGLAAGQPPDPESIDDPNRRTFYEMWTWFRGYGDESEQRPKLYIGYGTEDRLSTPDSFVADLLPAAQRATMPGGHKWTVWRPLFDQFVARALAPAASP